MPAKTPPAEPPQRDTWIDAFVVEIQHGSNLRAGKFLSAIATEQFKLHSDLMTGEAAAKAWLARQPGKR